MKEYLIELDYGSYNNIFIVSANNSKEAINKIWNEICSGMNNDMKLKNKEFGYDAYRMIKRKEVRCTSIIKKHEENGNIILIH